jgi:hypothetical protein
MTAKLFALAGVVAFLSGTQSTSAFTTQPVNPETTSNRLADPDELAERMSNGQHREQPISRKPGYGVRAE